jgi:hypothetical protein
MTKNFKILCTGNPNDRGVPNALQKLYPTATFLSRTTGYDFYEFSGVTEQKLREQLRTHNVLINYSWVTERAQHKILRIAAEEWTHGHVINIGSTNEDNEIIARAEPSYTEDKRQLRRLSLDLNNENFKTTHVVVGGFQGPSPGSAKTMDPMYVANSIKWIIEQDFEVPLFGIQQSSDYIRNWIKAIPQ